MVFNSKNTKFENSVYIIEIPNSPHNFYSDLFFKEPLSFLTIDLCMVCVNTSYSSFHYEFS